MDIVGFTQNCRKKVLHACKNLGAYKWDYTEFHLGFTQFGYGLLSDVTFLRPIISTFHVHSRGLGVAHY